MPYVLCGSEEREEFRDQVGRLEEEKEQFQKSTLELKGELVWVKILPQKRFVKEFGGVTEERSLEAEIARDKAWVEVLEEKVKLGGGASSRSTGEKDRGFGGGD
ncbi:hypothetical protein BGX38DRAFT_1147685 [Terfezia claveryi]|nr:hypothetical protein BGX38DRAFT_1147685 [Terfezia claveryi]